MGSLIDEIRSGNKDAVKTIYQEYAKDVYNFAKSITGDHDSALAATKKTFVKLFNSIKKGENPDNIRTALLKVAYDEACAIAMPSGSKQTTEKPAERSVASAPQKPQQKREEIYMPKGGYDSLKVDDNTGIEEVERRPAPRRPRPENAPRRRRPMVNEVTEEVEEIQEEAAPVVVPVIEESAPREEYPRKERRPRRKVDPVVEEFDEDAEEEYVEEKPRRKKSSKSRKYEEEYEEEEDVDVYDPLDDSDEYEDEEDDDVKPRNKGLFIFCIILNVVLILILLWFLCGLLVNLSVLPEIDLGYTWFNSHIYPLF